MESFDALAYDDEIVYTGPSDLPGNYAAPEGWKMPYRFRYVSVGGTLACHTKYNGNKYLSPDHPANDPSYWEEARP